MCICIHIYKLYFCVEAMSVKTLKFKNQYYFQLLKKVNTYINLTKHVQDMHDENCKTVMKQRRKSINGDTYCIHELEA